MTNRAPTPSQPGSNLEDPVALLREAARLARRATPLRQHHLWGPLAILLDETANTCEVDRSEYGSNDRMLSADYEVFLDVARAIVKAQR